MPLQVAVSRYTKLAIRSIVAAKSTAREPPQMNCPTYIYADGELEKLEAARSLYNTGDGDGCLFLLKRLAGEGRHSAFSMIAHVYETGCGPIAKKSVEAVKWYKRSIETIDDIVSHRGLARLYLQDFGLDPSHKLVRYHLELLVNQDVMGGYFGMGILYQHGIGVPVDYPTAASYFMKAISHGHLMAEVRLRQVSGRSWFSRLVPSLITARKIGQVVAKNDDNSVLTI